MSLENGEWSSDRVLLKDLCDLDLCVAFGTHFLFDLDQTEADPGA